MLRLRQYKEADAETIAQWFLRILLLNWNRKDSSLLNQQYMRIE